MKFTSQYDLVKFSHDLQYKTVGIKRFENVIKLNEFFGSKQVVEEFAAKHKYKKDFVLGSWFERLIKEGWYGGKLQKLYQDGMPLDKVHGLISNPSNLQYDNMELVDRLSKQVTDGLNTQLSDTIPKKKLAYNDLGLGVFSFDRAAQGMYRLNEYYSPLRNEVVDPMLVVSSSDGFIDKRDSSYLIERQELKPDGTIKVRTTTKKVWAYFPKVTRQKAAIDMYIGVGNSASLSEEAYMYTAVGAIIFANMLTKGNIPFRINVVYSAIPEVNGGKSAEFYAGMTIIKDYNDALDSNLLAKLTGDVSYGRFQGNYLSALASMVFGGHYGNQYDVSSSTLHNILTNYTNIINKTLNISNPNNIVCFSGAKTLNDAVRDVNQAANYVNGLLNH